MTKEPTGPAIRLADADDRGQGRLPGIVKVNIDVNLIRATDLCEFGQFH